MIRDNGNWDCFKVIQIKEFPRENRRQKEAEEVKVLMELKANMNGQRAIRSTKQYYNDNRDKILEQKN